MCTWRTHLSAFRAAAGAEQRARSTGSTSSLSKLSEIRAVRSLNFDNEHRRRAPPAKRFNTKLESRADRSLNFDNEHRRKAPPAKGFNSKLDDSYAFDLKLANGADGNIRKHSGGVTQQLPLNGTGKTTHASSHYSVGSLWLAVDGWWRRRLTAAVGRLAAVGWRLAVDCWRLTICRFCLAVDDWRLSVGGCWLAAAPFGGRGWPFGGWL